jgi:hypothetical protein
MPEPRRAFNTLVGLHIRELRGQFVGLLLFTLVVPLAFTLAVHALPQLIGITTNPAPETNISPSLPLGVVAALLGCTWVVLPQQVAHMRETRQFNFLAGYAIGQGTYLLAALTAYALAALPGVLLVPTLAAYALHEHFTVHPTLLAEVPLGFLALTATGGMLGLLRMSIAATTALTTALYIGALGLLTLLSFGITGTPHTLALLAPSSLASDLLSATSFQQPTNSVVADVVGLLIYSVGGGYLVVRLLPWRANATQTQPSN